MISAEMLEQVGLTRSEASIYLALLELGACNATMLARKTGLHRRTVYDSTERLIEKGLIGYILKNNRRQFQAANPEMLLEIAKEKQEKIKEMIPILLQKFSYVKEKEETAFFKGKAGLKTVLEEELKAKELLIMGSLSAYQVLQFYFSFFDRKRKEKKIKTRVLLAGKKRIPYAQTRFLDEKYASDAAINIYEDKVAIILWQEKPLAIVIKNKIIAEGFKKYFELLWKSARKI